MMKSIIAAAVAVLLGTAATGQNILVNSGFETGSLDPWFASNGSPFVTSDEAHTGTFSAAAFGSDEIRQNFAAIDASLITEVSIWVKRLGGAFDQYTFYYDDGSSENFLISDIGGGDDWKQHTLTANLDVSKNLNGFSIFGTSSGPAFFDDVVIAVVPAPATLALLGLVGVVGVRRRRRD